MKTVNSYAELLNALDAGEKKIEVSKEFFEWISTSVDNVKIHKVKGVSVATYYGMDVYVKKGVNE